jgi:hypothetical protein
VFKIEVLRIRLAEESVYLTEASHKERIMSSEILLSEETKFFQ